MRLRRADSYDLVVLGGGTGGLASAHGDKIDAVSTTVHAYPTMAEAPARAADDYLRQKYARPLPRALSRLALGARRLI